MKIKTRLYLSAYATIGLIALLIAISLSFSSEMKKQLERNRFASELSRKIAELVLVTDEYLAYRYERSAQQWEMKYEEIFRMARNEHSAFFGHLQTDMESLRGSFLSLESAAQKQYQLGNNASGKEVKHTSILAERLGGRIRLISNKIMVDTFNISRNTLTQIEDLQRKGNVIDLAVALLLICLISASSYFTIRKITKPLRRLVESAAIIEKGNFEHQMSVQNLDPDSRPRDEIGELSASFKSMTRKLIQSIEDLKTEVLERKQAEEALRESEEKYRRVSDNSPAVLYHFMMTPDGAFSFPYVSDVVEAILGIRPEDIMKDPSKLLGMVHPEDKEIFQEGIMKSAESLESFPLTFRCMKDGEVIWIEARGAPSPLPDGGILWDGFLLDITKRKLAEEELKKHREHLEKLVEERTKELTEKVTELERFYDATVERELRMKEMRGDMEKLKAQTRTDKNTD